MTGMSDGEDPALARGRAPIGVRPRGIRHSERPVVGASFDPIGIGAIDVVRGGQRGHGCALARTART